VPTVQVNLVMKKIRRPRVCVDWFSKESIFVQRLTNTTPMQAPNQRTKSCLLYLFLFRFGLIISVRCPKAWDDLPGRWDDHPQSGHHPKTTYILVCSFRAPSEFSGLSLNCAGFQMDTTSAGELPSARVFLLSSFALQLRACPLHSP
jgi:hypothetical protein